MSVDQIDYLRSLVRMDIRKKERGLSDFKPKVWQNREDAARVRAEFEANLQFRREVLAALEEERS